MPAPHELSCSLAPITPLPSVSFGTDTFCPNVAFRSFVTREWKSFLKTLARYEKLQSCGLPRRCFLIPSSTCLPLLLKCVSLQEVVVLGDPCVQHPRPESTGAYTAGWCFDKGEVLPTMETYGERAGGEIFDRYVIEYIDMCRGAWSEKMGSDLRFVYKRVCWGGECWKNSDTVEDGIVGKPGKVKGVVKRAWAFPKRGAAKVLMHIV
jgi:hypothetical protein